MKKEEWANHFNIHKKKTYFHQRTFLPLILPNTPITTSQELHVISSKLGGLTVGIKIGRGKMNG